ncbi:MAG: hypothetical protein C3F02_03700 [Parcubacteria group bacterium]|nr:MAG: hypothetical protein C3F02_03700 [Parcubacteria group bacterium]
MANYKKIDEVLDLAHRTGDKVIVVSEFHDPYMIMSVKEYEALLHRSSPIKDMTEDQLLEKINRDIAVWKASQDEGTDLTGYDLDKFRVDKVRKEPVTGAEAPSILSEPAEELVDEPVDEKYYLEPID